jgi:hypothetical protein
VAPIFGAETALSCSELAANHTPSIDAPWECPKVDGSKAELAGVDFASGKYTCKYSYEDSGSMMTSCSFSSEEYKTAADDKIKEIDGILQKRDATTLNLFDINFNNITLDKKEQEIIRALSKSVDETLGKLNGYFVDITGVNSEGKRILGYLVNLNPSLNDIAKTSYEALVLPYVTDRDSDDNRTNTFSRFITGMITLDPEVVTGYSEINGKLLIAEAWTKKEKKGIFDLILSFFRGEKTLHETFNAEEQNIKGWVEIFQEKIWGFYYNLQRRLDIGYDIISTQLLFIMMAFFAITATARGGARYITNREGGQSSGEVKVNEATIMKTLGILATVFVFYISVPSEISSDLDATISTDIPNEMRGNNSLIKEFIRYAIKEGTYFGTMMADLGTDAFLDFVVKKQGLFSGEGENNNFANSLKALVYYYPAQEIVDECKNYYQLSEDRFVSSGRGQYSINPDYKITRFPHDNNINGISFELCMQAHRKSVSILKALDEDSIELRVLMDKDKYLRVKATKAMAENHIALQKDLGWMNIISVPYTYFMMKNQELFFESSYDWEAAQSTARAYVDNLELRDSNDVLQNTAWFSNTEEARQRVEVAKQIDKDTRKISQYAFYNFLPGFTSIKNEIIQKLQALYSDILREENLHKGQKTHFMKQYKELLRKAVKKAKLSYRKGPDTEKEILANIALIEHNPVLLHMTLQTVGYVVAMGIWKAGFVIVFLSSIAMIIGIKIVLYVINVMIHFFVSPFVVVWAFATTDAGMGKIKGYMRDTLIYMLYPSIIVLGVFVFIFAYELFYSIYSFIISTLVEGQLKTVGMAIAGNYETPEAKAQMSYLALYSLRDLTEILIDLLSVYVAFVTINKFPELVLKMLGLGESSVIMLAQAAEKVQSQGGGHVSPLSR